VYLKLAFLRMAVALSAGPQEPGEAIDTQRSSITIHVGKSGLFAAAAHEHWGRRPHSQVERLTPRPRRRASGS
jgi:hypothetical protein